MSIFYIGLVISYLTLLIDRLYRKDNEKISIVAIIVVIILLSIISGSRTEFVDTRAYIHLYKYIDNINIFNDSYEFGFIIIFKILHKLSKNPQFMLFATAFITNSLLLITLRRYSKGCYSELIIYMYITGGTFISSMNGMRQYLAAAVLFYFTYLIEKKSMYKYIFVCLLCSTIHISSLIMIPVYFLVNIKAFSKKTIIVILFSVVFIIFFYPIINFLYGVIGGKFSQYKSFNEGGANFIRILVECVPLVLAFIYRKLFDRNKFNVDLFINMSLLNSLIMIVSLYNWIFARFAIYLGLYNLILLPYIIKSLVCKRERKIIYYLFLVFYFIFFYYESIVSNIKYIGLFN
ncbi:TPA: EpsG family protein [Clostridium perfringens]|uniref:EpsG family protein n=1 Tax=Clostridium perfringens TaxID=1502 RepID=UPI001A2C527D|nr:EpsG family protein [Clostridium perfringens]HAT4131467.1 EpsG family protein [Clostridium perfringens]HAT4132493.1 EpsG family protein [Clostridium perfringens]